MIERVESLKAGGVAAFSFIIEDLIVRFFNQKVFAIQWSNFSSLLIAIDDQIWWKIIISGFSGFLFGVTYRYIIRTDKNSHLKDGAVFAFGLTRSLVSLENLSNLYFQDLIPYLIFIGENLFCFYIVRFCLDLGIFYKLLSPYFQIEEIN